MEEFYAISQISICGLGEVKFYEDKNLILSLLSIEQSMKINDNHIEK